jgi:hypothetical protein
MGQAARGPDRAWPGGLDCKWAGPGLNTTGLVRADDRTYENGLGWAGPGLVTDGLGRAGPEKIGPCRPLLEMQKVSLFGLWKNCSSACMKFCS